MKVNFSHDVTGFTFMERSKCLSTIFRITLASVLGVSVTVAPVMSMAGAQDAGRAKGGHQLIDHKRIQDLKEKVAELKERVKDGSDQGVQAQLTDLQNKVAALTTANSSLVSQLQAAMNQLGLLQGRLTTLEASSGGSSSSLASLAKYVTVDPNPINGVKGPHVIFTGVNIHIRSGSGATNDGGTLTGLGNLIVGYNENPDPSIVYDVVGCDRSSTGSHNIVSGSGNLVTSYGGLAMGSRNCITGQSTTILGGDLNEAHADWSTILGGFRWATYTTKYQTVPLIR